MIRILLVDDQNLVQQGIKSLLERDPEIEVIGTVKDGRSAVIKINELNPDIVLLDIEMPGMDGITTTKYISHLAPQIKVIILSSHEDKKYLTQALMAGAKAYILKNSLMADLRQSIIAVNSGYSHIESRLLAKIFDPSNLKSSNDKKTRPQNLKPSKTVAHQSKNKTRTREEIDNFASKSTSVFPDRPEAASSSEMVVSDVVVSEASDRPVETARAVNNKTVPKINLPYADSANPLDSNPESDSNVSDGVDEMPPPIPTSKQLLPSTNIQDSASPLSTTVENRDRQTFIVTVNGKNHVQQIDERPKEAKYKRKIVQFWTKKKAQYQPLIERCESELDRYRARIMPVLKQWHEKGWLANIGLGFLGLITVIIIHLMFS